MPKPVAETRARVNAHARETDTQFMEQLEFQAAQAAWGGLGQMTVLTMRYLRGHFVVTGPDIEPEIQVMLRTGATTSIIRARPCEPSERASKSKARLSYGHGNASGQILGEALKYRLNLNIVRVPYSSNPTALTDLLSLRSARILVAKSLGDLIIRGTGCARSSNSAQNTSRFCETRSRALKVLCTAKVVSD